MAKIPKFKNIQEEREFWATHDFADYVDDTTDVVRPKDRNATRQKSWTVNVYLTHEEGIALAELAKSMGESKSTILRQALHKLLSDSGGQSTSSHETFAPGNSVGPLVERIAYIGAFLSTENPTRDVDLARMLKSVLQAALPGPQIEVMLKRVRKMEEDFSGMLARGIEIKGKLSKRETALVLATIIDMVERSIGTQLRGRHPASQSAA